MSLAGACIDQKEALRWSSGWRTSGQSPIDEVTTQSALSGGELSVDADRADLRYSNDESRLIPASICRRRCD